MKILRVFPRRTNATPDDCLVRIGSPDLFAEQAEPDRVHISVSFTWKELLRETRRMLK
ncbi:MAG: hypothetical protein LBK73_12170 [Treponema sp.]|jgi:hypothetical protein|nr:hypothetical protein [Treponema sp.]